MIFYTLQGFVGKRAIPILQCGLNYSIAWPVVRVHSANPLRYPDGPLDVNVWGVLGGACRHRHPTAGRTGGQRRRMKKEVNMETTTHKRVCFSGRRGGKQ